MYWATLQKTKVEDKAPLLYEHYDWLEVKHRMDARGELEIPIRLVKTSDHLLVGFVLLFILVVLVVRLSFVVM
jgi:hypothetical protein